MQLTTRKVPPQQKCVIYEACIKLCSLLNIPKYQHPRISVKFLKQKDTDGLTWIYNDTIYVEINSSIINDPETLFETLAHEFVHVKQYVKGDLMFIDDVEHWKGMPIKGNTQDYKIALKLPDEGYENLPWEKEAIKKSKKLVLKLNEHIVKYKEILDNISNDSNTDKSNS